MSIRVDPFTNDRWVDSCVGKYRITARLGQGGMGVVYAAVDTLLEREVALKLLPDAAADDPVAAMQFLLEAKAAARLSHPNVVGIYDVGQIDDARFIAMELVRGVSVQESLRTRGAFDWRTATRIASQVCHGLAAAHMAHLIHRDIKPANVLLADDGAVKLADFGVAKRIDQTLGSLRAGVIVGTPDFMSPEQCRSDELDECSDIYSLGATYHTMLTGQPPFTAASPVQVMFAHCAKEAPDPREVNSDIPEGCAAIVRRALAKDRNSRFRSAADMAAALEAVLDGTDRVEHAAETVTCLAVERPLAVTSRAADGQRFVAIAPRSRSRRHAWATVLAILAASGASAAWQWQADKPPVISTGPTLVSAGQGVLADRQPAPEPIGLFQLDSPGTILAVSADEQWLAVGGREGDVGFRVLNLDTGAPIAERRFRLPRGRSHQEVTALEFAPSGTWLAVAVQSSDGGELAIWNLAHEQHPPRVMALGSSIVSGLDFSPDETMLAAACNDNASGTSSLLTWTCPTWKQSTAIPLRDAPASWVSFSSSQPGQLAFAAGQNVFLQGMESPLTPEILESLLPENHGACASESDLLAVVVMHYLRLRWIDGKTPPQLLEVPSGNAGCVAVSRDGAWVAVGGGTERGGLVTLYDTGDLRHPIVVRGHTARVSAVAFLPRRRLLATTGLDHTVRLWSLDDIAPTAQGNGR